MHLLKLKISLILSLKNIISRTGGHVPTHRIKQLGCDHVSPLLEGDEALALSGRVSKVEKVVERKAELKEHYAYLMTIPGVGKILSLTIMLETGSIDRFPSVGNYASYCRKVPTQWTSDGKRKGAANKKNGNKYLSWAFSEAAEFGRRFDPTLRAYYNRKAARTNVMTAHSTVAHKLARAAYYIMRDRIAFDPKKFFG